MVEGDVPADEPGDSAPAPVDFGPDELVDNIQRGARGPQDLSTLTGFFGESDAPGYHRLFTDETLQSWVDIRDDDIRYRHRISGEEDAYGGRSVVWVVNGAILVNGSLSVAGGAEAGFLTGPLSAGARVHPCDGDVEVPTKGSGMGPKFAGSPDQTPRGAACCIA
jgi:hypothetical protein